MRDEWREVRLGDITQWKSGGTPSKGNPQFWAGHIPWISAKNMPDGWVENAEPQITQSGLENGSSLAPVDSILMLVRGSGLFNRRYISIVKKPVAFNQDIKCIESDSATMPLFLFYLLRGNDAQLLSMLETTGIGAGKFDTKRLQNMVVNLPPISEQRAIAATLSCLDDKIELNNKINANLEAQAQAIFKNWFVDFEPFQDGEFVDSELGMIPKGWRVGTIGDVIRLQRGHDLPIANTVSGQYPVLGSKGIIAYHNKYTTKAPCIVMGRSGNIGNPRYYNCDAWAHNTSLYVKEFRCMPLWIFYILSQIDYAVFKGGSAVPTLNRNHVELWKITIPPNNIQNKFHDVVDGFMQQIKQNKNQSRTLTAIRDALLPKLMSGEIEVPLEDE